MPLLVDRIGEVEINVLIWVGRVTKAEALAMPGRIDPARPEFGSRWICYFDPTADMSDLDAACLVELRERLRPIVAGLAAGGEFKMILASNSIYNDPLMEVWRAMTTTDADYASNPVFVRDLDAASRELGLSAAEAGRVHEWIMSRVEGLLPG